MCGSYIEYPKCGNNCCNGVYGIIDGKDCDICLSAYEYQRKNLPPKELMEKWEGEKDTMIDLEEELLRKIFGEK